MSRGKAETTTTLYGFLGLLAVRPMTTYELAKHFDRSLGRTWPRARSKLYEAPKKLVEMGLARASKGRTGLRPKTVYTITPNGRRGLAAWLAEPGAGPELECEQLVKVFFGEHGGKDAIVTNLEAARDWARAQIDEHLEVGSAYLEGRGAFQERIAVNSITGRFLAEFALTVERWAGESLAHVESWPEDPLGWRPDRARLEDMTRRLEATLAARH
ncbi:MAG: PadR family transcriptional regulator [Actinomycetota bacterium]